jgi:hypothetical protein
MPTPKTPTGADRAPKNAGRSGGRLAKDAGSKDEMKRAVEPAPGATRVRKSDERAETRDKRRRNAQME